MKKISKIVFGAVMAAAMVLTLIPTANAQRRSQDRNRNGVNDRFETNRRNDRNRNGVNDRFEVNRRNDRNRNGVNDRFEVDRNGNIDRNRNGVDDRYENRRNGGYYGNNGGYYGNNGGYYGNGNYRNSAEYQKGYRDGLDRGQKDRRDRRIADPDNSSHYRKGNQDYREGFRRGYSEGYPQYRNNRNW